MRVEHSIRNILLLCLRTQNIKVSLHRSLNGAVGFVSESLLWSQQLCWSFKYHRRFFIFPVLPLKWSTICDDEKCPVLSDQPSLTTNVFSCAYSLCSDCEAPKVWQCWLLLCWAENASVGLRCCECWVQDWHHTLHTLLWGLSAQGQTGAGQHSLNRQTQQGLGVSAWKPPLYVGQPSLSAALCHSDGDTCQDGGVVMQKL